MVLIPLTLNAFPGTRYGIPCPVVLRASFGIIGSNVPSLIRAIVACGWFGIQTWIGGAAIYTIVLIAWPFVADGPAMMPEWVGVSLIQFACFMLFWFMNIWLIWKGINSIRILEHVAAPFLLLCGLALLVWAYKGADGFGPMLDAPPTLTGDLFFDLFFPSLTAMVGFWATLTLNISDFTRYAKDQRAQVLGQLSGLPTTMTLFAFIGVANYVMLLPRRITTETPLHRRGKTGTAAAAQAGFFKGVEQGGRVAGDHFFDGAIADYYV